MVLQLTGQDIAFRSTGPLATVDEERFFLCIVRDWRAAADPAKRLRDFRHWTLGPSRHLPER